MRYQTRDNRRFKYASRDLMGIIEYFLKCCLIKYNCPKSTSCVVNMSSDKFSLKWEQFCNNAATSFQALHKDTDFTDVTLASSDGQTVGAHKVVLSSCSPVLKLMLGKNSHPSPLLYLRGVKLSQLKTLLTFCYLGQAEVLQTDLEEFLEVARDLDIKGLSQEDTQEQNQEHVQKNRRQKNYKKSFEFTAQNSTDIGSEIIISSIKTESFKGQI